MPVRADWTGIRKDGVNMGKAERYLSQIPMWTKKKNSLEDVRGFLEALGSPDRSIPAIHVAGTNGKGSVCAFLTSMLREAGYKTGTFISPHLVEVRERFLINGIMVDRDVFEDGFNTVLETAGQMMEKGYCHPTFFEFLFYMAMVIFKAQGTDVMIVETGMGGRLDTTNVLERPLASVITSISMDHIQYLGDTLPKIAGEKAGIIKTGVPLIFDDNQPQVSTVLEGYAFRRGAPRYPVNRKDCQVEEIGDGFLLISGRMENGDNLRLKIPFEAFYQAENAMLAVRALEVLRKGADKAGRGGSGVQDGLFNITDQQIVNGIENTVWPGRMEMAMPGVYLDGAHNPGGIQAFIQTASEISERLEQQPWLLFAAVSDKDYGDMVRQLSQGISWKGIGVVRMGTQRGVGAGVLAGEFKKYAACPVFSFDDTETAVREMAGKRGSGLLFCAGSLYLIGEIKAALGRIGVDYT